MVADGQIIENVFNADIKKLNLLVKLMMGANGVLNIPNVRILTVPVRYL
jgi:hypothetical protein